METGFYTINLEIGCRGVLKPPHLRGARRGYGWQGTAQRGVPEAASLREAVIYVLAEFVR